MNDRIKLIKGDITILKVDAVVNAANSRLAGGGGVDGAIHKAAGPALSEACKSLNGCATGSAKITPGFSLPSKYIIHTVGPVWRGGHHNEEVLLRSCYNACLELAIIHQCERIAFPNISTGIYGFPKIQAAKIATESVKSFLRSCEIPQQVIFVCFDDINFEIYQDLLAHG